MSSGDMGLGRRTHGWLSCSRRPGGLPTISCHHVDSGRYWRFPAEWPCTGSSVELAVHVGSATARGVYGPVECARRWASREAAGRQLIRVAQRQHRSQGDPHGRPHRAAVTPLDRAYLCRLRGNLGGYQYPCATRHGYPNCGSTCHRCFSVSGAAERHSADVVATLPGTPHNPSPESNRTMRWPAQNTNVMLEVAQWRPRRR